MLNDVEDVREKLSHEAMAQKELENKVHRCQKTAETLLSAFQHIADVLRNISAPANEKSRYIEFKNMPKKPMNRPIDNQSKKII